MKHFTLKQLWETFAAAFTLMVLCSVFLFVYPFHGGGQGVVTCILILAISLFVGAGTKLINCYEELEAQNE